MKKSNYLLSTLFSLVTLSTAPAAIDIRITGAQAFGDAVHRAILHVLTDTGSSFTYAYTGTDINKAQQSIWTGTIALPTGGTDTIYFRTSWNGSTAGVRVVTTNEQISFLKTTTLQSSAGTPSALNTGAAVESLVADVAAVDTFQNTTVYRTPVLTDLKVGAGAYVFVASKDAPVRFNNISTQQAQALYGVGRLPLAVFTGQDSDRTAVLPATNEPAYVYATGRDPESGARLVTLVETGIGGNANLVQYKPTIGTGALANSIISHVPYPAVTRNGIDFLEGSDGNPSNGNLATVVLPKSTLATLGGYYVSYLPTLDAANAVAAGAHYLAYNGVPYTPENVANGAYSIWAYEHLLYRANLSAVQNYAIANLLGNKLLSTDATLRISSLNVSRPIDGGTITNDY